MLAIAAYAVPHTVPMHTTECMHMYNYTPSCLVSQCAFLCAEGDEEKKCLMDDKHPDYSKSNVDFVTMIMSS